MCPFDVPVSDELSALALVASSLPPPLPHSRETLAQGLMGVNYPTLQPRSRLHLFAHVLYFREWREPWLGQDGGGDWVSIQLFTNRRVTPLRLWPSTVYIHSLYSVLCVWSTCSITVYWNLNFQSKLWEIHVAPTVSRKRIFKVWKINLLLL